MMDAKNIALEVHENEEKEKKALAEKWCDNVVSREIEDAAKAGRWYCHIEMPTKCDAKYAVEYIEKHEYVVDVQGRNLRICWGE